MNRQASEGGRHWGTPQWIILGWCVLNLLQAVFTELFHDEAYYWWLSTRLQMGYAEHAPGMMVLIRLTSWIPGELGVRLFPVLMNTASVWLIYRILDPKAERTAFLLLFGMAGLHAVAFFAAPDSPLFFFTVLFWWAYQRYLKEESWTNALWLGLIIPLMLYSKYHGAMVVFFVVLSNPALWRKKTFWFIAGLSFLLFLPHLIWLWQDDFGTFRFHLGDRNPGPWYVGRTLEFWLALVLLTGPLLSWIMIPLAAKRKPVDLFERGLKWTFFGVFAFLTLLTFRSRVEGNWAASAMVPLFILGYRALEDRDRLLQYARVLASVTLVVLMLIRLYLAWDFWPLADSFRNEVHGWRTWSQELKEKAAGKPVLFLNWYQYPSKYAFYSGEEALGLSNAYYHPTQISEWTDEAALQNQEVMVMSTNHFQFADTFPGPSANFYYAVVDSFRSFSHIHVEVDNLTWDLSGEQPELSLMLTQTADTAIAIRKEEDVRITGILFEGGKQLKRVIQEPTLEVTLQPGVPTRVTYPIREMDRVSPGTYRFAIGLAVKELLPTRNSDWLEVTIVR